jgi:hypothetical protein
MKEIVISSILNRITEALAPAITLEIVILFRLGRMLFGLTLLAEQLQSDIIEERKRKGA